MRTYPNRSSNPTFQRQNISPVKSWEEISAIIREQIETERRFKSMQDAPITDEEHEARKAAFLNSPSVKKQRIYGTD